MSNNSMEMVAKCLEGLGCDGDQVIIIVCLKVFCTTWSSPRDGACNKVRSKTM
jgi:hypothetical protein